jgi:hypothetical protein
MIRQERSVPLPTSMQGSWRDIEEPDSLLVVDGGEVSCFGSAVEYDYKEVEEVDGALTVGLRVCDDAAFDDFHRANVTDLVIAPNGEFYAYNLKFNMQLKRAD